MTTSLASKLFALVAVAWIAAVAVWASNGWPHIPLDMTGRDAATAAAYGRAVRAHVIEAALVAGIPVLIGGIVLLVARRRSGSG